MIRFRLTSEKPSVVKCMCIDKVKNDMKRQKKKGWKRENRKEKKKWNN